MLLYYYDHYFNASPYGVDVWRRAVLLSVLDLVLQEPGIEVGRRHTTIHIPRSTEHSKISKIHINTLDIFNHIVN